MQTDILLELKEILQSQQFVGESDLVGDRFCWGDWTFLVWVLPPPHYGKPCTLTVPHNFLGGDTLIWVHFVWYLVIKTRHRGEKHFMKNVANTTIIWYKIKGISVISNLLRPLLNMQFRVSCMHSEVWLLIIRHDLFVSWIFFFVQKSK